MSELFEKYKNKRVVLTTCHNVSYAGEIVGKIVANEREGVVCELDSKTGVSIFCPISAIKEVMEVPIPKE